MNGCLVDFDSELFLADLLWGSADPYGVYVHFYLEIGIVIVCILFRRWIW